MLHVTDIKDNELSLSLITVNLPASSTGGPAHNVRCSFFFLNLFTNLFTADICLLYAWGKAVIDSIAEILILLQ